MRGFILTRHWRDLKHSIQLDFWLATDAGPVQLSVAQQKAVCFFREADRTSVDNILTTFPSVSYQPVALNNVHGEKVLALYCPQQRLLRELTTTLAERGITVWEQDIKPHERFLMERFITASLEFLGSPRVIQPANAASFQRVKTTQIKPADYKPRLKVISLDIETSLDGKELFSIAVYGDGIAQVFMVNERPAEPASDQTALADKSLIIHWCVSARECLLAFMDWLNHYDPDVLIGWHVVQFDLWMLQQFCERWQVGFDIGRHRERTHWRDDSQKPDRRYVSIPGRVVLDGIELLRMAFYHFESFTLQHVAETLLGESKLLHQDNRAEAIADLFATDKVALAQYNLQDCKLVWAIFEKTQLLDFAVARSSLTGMAMDRAGGSVASFEYAYLPRLHRAGYVAPSLGELTSSIISPGGYVMRSQPGLYQHVLVLDFKSLYPSIIRTFNIDPYAFWITEHQQLSPGATVPGFNGARFAREGAILPGVVAELWQAREQAKRDDNKPLSQAIKIIMNAFYGVLGSSGCRFFDPRISSSITLRGHEIIQQSREWIVGEGYQVIYGDTDSVFVRLDDQVSHDQARHIGQTLAQGLNTWWQHKLKSELDIDSALEIEFETHYSPFLMPTIRGSNKGSKKRYAGVITHTFNDRPHTQPKEELVFKGMETVRTDWTELAKGFQQTLYLKVFKGQPYKRYICELVDDLLAGRLDEQLIYKKRLRKPLEGYDKSNPPHVKAARKQAQFSGESMRSGDPIHYLLTINGPEPIAFQTSLIDYQHYIDKQLQPVADSILTFLDERFTDIIEQQLRLL